MDLDFTAEQRHFREQIRTWLEENKPAEPRPPHGFEARAYDLEWQKTLYEGGYAGINWPKAYGGCGFNTFQQLIWLEEYAKAGAPPEGYRFNGMNIAGPTLIAEGTEEQKAYHLPKLLKGEVVWCQGFSEPSAGSDVASVRTRGIIDNDEIVVSGQKIWTSFARFADWQQLLIRTDPEAPKHKGLTWVINKMDNPGMDIRPIRDMAGNDDLHEVFYDEVRIPLANVVGQVNDGWRVSLSTLSVERGTAFMPMQVSFAHTVEQLLELARETVMPDGRRAIAQEGLARNIAMLRASGRALHAMTLLGISRNERYGMPGPEGSMLKLVYSELSQEASSLALEILGPEKLDRSIRRGGGEIDGDPQGSWVRSYLSGHAATIGGGTSEIQRNIIGERVLGLPR